MHTSHASYTRRPSHRQSPVTAIMRSILAVVFMLGVCWRGVAAATEVNESNTEQHSHRDIFNPALAAAFKVGLANVAAVTPDHSHRNKRASAFGSHAGGNANPAGKRMHRRAPQLLSDVLGEEGDVLDAQPDVRVLLDGGTLTSGSISTVRVVPTTYVTTEGGERSECILLLYSSFT